MEEEKVRDAAGEGKQRQALSAMVRSVDFILSAIILRFHFKQKFLGWEGSDLSF